ncbi:hypothetical protein [Pseudomonas syringae]|nr:hypothetical protein [Pseudomonas syringae]
MAEIYKMGGSPDWTGTRLNLMCMTLDKHGLTLNASDSDEEVVVNLKSLAFRQMDEGDALSIPWGQIEGMDYFFIGTVKNSNYLE